ncbi:hypothetical protein P1X14_02115 [Sphingomonas sp. AOB5]|uniref:hypothetical protein n=1 Tax=Sphingomonas sp. AOB5 TaxID=3034017 RepID=UPI0023F69929|nr:hypothetical protein [Sphingomonas sp. AOB5]MDF7774029.1 hypothetical protein [Sphingomonas sp. AOB5]
MKLRLSFLAALSGAAALTGCATLTGGDLVRQGEASGWLIVQNQSGVGIDVVTLSRCSAMSHGLNRLGNQQVIYNNSSMRFPLGAGCWDIMVGRSGTCNVQSNGASSCNWLQSQSRRFTITAGTTQTIAYGYNE